MTNEANKNSFTSDNLKTLLLKAVMDRRTCAGIGAKNPTNISQKHQPIYLSRRSLFFFYVSNFIFLSFSSAPASCSGVSCYPDAQSQELYRLSGCLLHLVHIRHTRACNCCRNSQVSIQFGPVQCYCNRQKVILTSRLTVPLPFNIFFSPSSLKLLQG